LARLEADGVPADTAAQILYEGYLEARDALDRDDSERAALDAKAYLAKPEGGV
jgi:hypothetical protein